MKKKAELPKSMQELQGLSADKLKKLWCRYFKDKDRAKLDNMLNSKGRILLRSLWYKIQCEIFNLNLEQKNITRLNRYSTDPDKHIENSNKTKYHLRSGTEIVKKYKGREYKILVKSPSEFIYNDSSYKTLSAVALAICKNKVSGYDFFGLNNKQYQKCIKQQETELNDFSSGQNLIDDHLSKPYPDFVEFDDGLKSPIEEAICKE